MSIPKILFESSATPLTLSAIFVAVFIIFLVIFFQNGRPLVRAVIRSLIFLFIIAALFGPYRESIKTELSATLLVDISESMDPSTATKLLEQARQLTKDFSNIEMLPFAANSAPYSIDFSSRQDLGELRRAWGQLNVGATDLSQPIELASRSDSSLMLLISDGWHNQGAIERVLSDVSLKRKSIFPLAPLENSISQQFFLQQMRVPLLAPSASQVDISVSAKNSSSQAQSGKLVIRQGDQVLEEQHLELGPGEEVLISTQNNRLTDDIEEIEAELIPNNQDFASTRLTSYLASRPREKVLLLSGTEQDDRFLSKALTEQDFEVDSYLGKIDEDIFKDLSTYSVVILNNTPLTNLPPVADPRIKSFVRENGGGLLMIGGNRSFGLGNYIQSNIEEVLPVKLVPPRTEQRKLNRAVSLVIDKSRSMLQQNRMEYAREAAREAVRNLKDEDYLGIIAFDTTPFIVLPMQTLRNNRERAFNRIGTIFPVGRTNLFPTIEEARRSLLNVEAGRKHIIIMTDGALPDSGPKYLEQAQRVRMQGVTISTIMFSSERDNTLKEIADIGGGAFYQTTDGSALPRIYISDLKTAFGEQTMQEASEFLVRRGDGNLQSTAIQRFPTVKGYVQTEAKPGSNTELVTFANGKSDPLLVSHQSGKGRSTAFTSDANGRWSSQWISWPLFQKFWLEVVNSLRSNGDSDGEQIEFDLRHQIQGDTLLLQLSLFSEEFASLPIKAEITGPDSRTQQVDFRMESTPGKSSAALSDVIAGRHDITLQVGDSKLPAVAIHISGESFKEVIGRGFDLNMLYRLGEQSGGELNPTRERLMRSAKPIVTKQDLSKYLIFLALLLLLLEVYLRERGKVR